MTTLLATEGRHVFETMGTVVTVVAPDAGLTDVLRDDVFAAFHRLDERFSLYRPESEASAVASHRLLLRDASPEYRLAYDLAAEWTDATEGAFTAHRPDGAIDLSGVVKALGIRDAGALLSESAGDWCLNAGGDVLVSGHERPGKPWVVGIVDPDDRTRLVSQFTCSPGFPAVATSGVAERGEHIWRVGSDATFVQVSVAASDIITADVLATAILAGGPRTLELATRRWRVEVLAFGGDGAAWATPAFRSASARNHSAAGSAG